MAMDFQQLIGLNAVNRARIIDNAMPMTQVLQTQTIAGVPSSSTGQLVFQPRLTGLLRGFLVECNGTLANTGASQADRTNFGAFNFLSRIQFIDLNNQTRINTSGYHLAMLNQVKTRGFGEAVAPNLPAGFGNTYTVQSMASTIAASTGTAAVRVFYYVPVAYSDVDLRGAINSQVVNATMQLQLTVNPTPGYTTGTQLNAMAGGTSTAVAWSSGTVSVKVYQLYYDQLPGNGAIEAMPVVDLSTMYMIQDTTMPSLVVNTENTQSYANFRTFLSTFATYDNAGTFNTGSDISYWALQYANLTKQFQLDPFTVALYTRMALGYDTPSGAYYFDHRNYPIDTQNYGNAELVVYPTTVTSSASTIYIGYEMFSQQQSIVTASALPGR
jgi:hypothetical protein